jgi:hypothetical protein
MFVLQLFGKFMPFYPTLEGCRRFHSTHKLGLWTPLTSNPSNALSAVLKTGENGGWLTAVARWHMRYLLRRISRRRHDRAMAHSVSCIVWFHRASSSRTSSACAPAIRTSPPHLYTPFIMLAFFHLFLQYTPWILHLGQDLVARVIAVCQHPWVRPVLVEAGAELLTRGHTFAVDWHARYVSFFLFSALLIFFSAQARLRDFDANDIYLALSRGDTPRVKCMVLLMGEVVLLHFAVRLLERAVSLFFFLLGASADCIACSSSLCVLRDNGHGGGRVTLMVMTFIRVVEM